VSLRERFGWSPFFEEQLARLERSDLRMAAPKHDKAAAAEHKRRWKQLHQAARAMYRERDRDRG
jgi:hypothetical protein